MTGTLYTDTQAIIKYIIFSVTKQQILDATQNFYITKPIGFRSLPFSFLAGTVSRNRTFTHHMVLPLAEGLEMILRYLRWHLLC